MESDSKDKPVPSAFQKFDNFTRKLMSVPKSEIDHQAKLEEQRKNELTRSLIDSQQATVRPQTLINRFPFLSPRS